MSNNGFTRSVPPSDGPADELVGHIRGMLDRRDERFYARLATVSRVNAGTGMIAVQFYDDDYEGQQTKAAVAGVAFDVGDTVLCQPLSPTEWVVTQKMVTNAQDRRAISDQEIRNNAIRANHIQNGSVTPALLDRSYTTAAQATTIARDWDAVMESNLEIPLKNLQSQINALKNAPSGVTMAQVNDRITARVDSGNDSGPYLRHKHNTGQIRVETKNTSNLNTVLLRMRSYVVCVDQNRNKSGNPCGSRKNALQQVL